MRPYLEGPCTWLATAISALVIVAATGCSEDTLAVVDSQSPTPDAEPHQPSIDAGVDADVDSAAANSVADVEEFSCDETTAGWMIADPVGAGVGDARIQIVNDDAKVHQGKGALEFSYPIVPKKFPVLFNKAQTTELVSISFQIRSEKDSALVLSLSDIDGANFVYPIQLAAGQWTRIAVTPDDLSLSPSSPVAKDRIDTSALGVGFALVDTAPAQKINGHNTLWIDSVVVERAAIAKQDGPWIIDGRTETVSASTLVAGKIIIRNGGALEVSCPRFTVRGEIDVEAGSRLALQGSIVAIQQSHHGQYPINVAEQATLAVSNAHLISFFPINLLGDPGAKISLSEVSMVPSALHIEVNKGGSLEADHVRNLGEIVPTPGSRLTIKDTNAVLIWLPIYAAKATLQLPDAPITNEWKLPPDLGLELSIVDTDNVLWGLVTLPGSDLTLRDTTVLACGLVYWAQQPTVQTVKGLRNEHPYSDLNEVLSDRKMTLDNSTVATWNYYPMGMVKLIVEDSLFGEVLSFDQASADIRNSHCDGTGGYVGSLGTSHLSLSDSTIDANVVAYDNSELALARCEVNGDISATNNSVITLSNSTVNGLVRALGNARIEQAQ